MVSKSEQHAAFWVAILIVLEGVQKVLKFGPVERVRDDKGNLIPLNKKESIQQAMHAAICRLWSNWDTDYTAGGYNDVKSIVIPTLESYLNVTGLSWADNVSFRRFKMNAKGEIYFSSGVFNLDTKEWDNCWLTEAVWLEQQGFRNTALYSTTNDVASPEPAKVQDEPVELDFFQVAEAVPATKKSKK